MPLHPIVLQQIKNIPPEQRIVMAQEILKQGGPQAEEISQALTSHQEDSPVNQGGIIPKTNNVRRKFLDFGKKILNVGSIGMEGALLGLQGRPLSEHSNFQKNTPNYSEQLAQIELEEILRKRQEQGSPEDGDVQKVNNQQNGMEQAISTEAPPMFINKPKGANKYGAMEYETVDNPDYKAWQKAQEKLMKDKAGAEASLEGTRDFIRSFSESRKEIIDSGFKNVGKANMTGLGERFGAGVVEKTGTLPKTTKFINRLKVIANQTAREVEGGRITDQDRKVYADAMANAVKFPDETNIGLVSDALKDLKNKGGNIDPILQEFESSGVDLFKAIVEETRRVSGSISVGTKDGGLSDEEAYQIYLQSQ